MDIFPGISGFVRNIVYIAYRGMSQDDSTKVQIPS
jgi:hypothetical protein